jgi:type IX secretion system PorP/SprF family membrane protein
MKLSRLLPILVLLFCWQGLSAQDVHYTLFDYSPLRSNPALTGAFEGSVRIGGIYRSQWFTVGDATEFGTPSFYADAPIIRGFREQDWIGVGLFVMSDKYGSNDLQTSGGQLSASYHLANKKRTNILTLGAQYGRMQRSINYNSPIYEQIISANSGGLGLPPADGEFGQNQEEMTDFTDINVGLLYRTKIDKISNLEIGLAGLHLNSDDNALLTAGGLPSKREITAIGHAIYERDLDNDWSINPKLFWQTTEAGGNEVQIQAWAGKQMNADFKINFGLGYRAGDAANILFGIDYKDLRAALAYDLTISSANSITNYQGGFELGAYYIIKIYKQPELPPTILCPRF